MYKGQVIKIPLNRRELRPVTNLPPAQNANAGADLHFIDPLSYATKKALC